MKKNSNHLPFDEQQSTGRRHSAADQKHKKPVKRQRFPWGFAVLLIVLSVVVALFVKSLSSPDATWPTTTTTSEQQSQTTSPTVPPVTEKTETTQTAQPSISPTPASLSAKARAAALLDAGEAVMARIEQEPASRIGVFYYNLVGQESWSYQDDVPFVAASSIKIGLNTRLYTFIADGSISPDELLAYDSRPYPTGDYESGTGTIQSLPNGSTLTVRETSGLSIRISDNCGTNMIIRRLGGIDAINPWLNEVSGIIDYRQKVQYTNYAGQPQDGRHRTCAQDLGQMAIYLYERWVEKPEIYDPLIEDLSHTTFDFGIQKGIPENITVAHKIGTNGIYATENDVGIVFTNEPFVLCVMTEMADAGRARQVQADIASIFYDETHGWPYE